MVLDHDHLALEFLVFASGVIEGLPRGRSHLADQFTRASLSIVLNLEGAGHKTGKEMVVRIVSPVGDFQGSSMLVKLSQSCEA